MPTKPNKTELDQIAEFTRTEYNDRKGRRKDMEKDWKEVDRQVAMIPPAKPKEWPKWRTRTELSLQAEALEVLTSDSQDQTFPKERNWFKTFVALDDDKIEKFVNEAKIAGDSAKTEPFPPNQTSANMLVQAVMEHNHRKYPFREQVDVWHAEAFKYGMYVGQLKDVIAAEFSNDYRGTYVDKETIPVLAAKSIKNVYLDDSFHRMHNEGFLAKPTIIEWTQMSVKDLQNAAKKGGSERGWLMNEIMDIETTKGKNPQIEILKLEGDVFTEKRFLPNVIIWVGVNKNAKTIRFQFSEKQRSYLYGIYHREGESIYNPSPLMKAKTLQHLASRAIEAAMDSALLSAGGVVRYSSMDYEMAAKGGPIIEPNAKWASLEGIDVLKIGDIQQIFAMYTEFVRQWQELTGVTPARAGGATKSHTTAFAKETELARVQSRTKDYVRSLGQGPLTSFLYMEYEMLRKMKKQVVPLPNEGFVMMSGAMLPKHVLFEVLGASGPFEERQKEQLQVQSILSAAQLNLAIQEAGGTPMDLEEAQLRILRIGDVPELDRLIPPSTELSQATQTIPGIPGNLELLAGGGVG